MRDGLIEDWEFHLSPDSGWERAFYPDFVTAEEVVEDQADCEVVPEADKIASSVLRATISDFEIGSGFSVLIRGRAIKSGSGHLEVYVESIDNDSQSIAVFDIPVQIEE